MLHVAKELTPQIQNDLSQAHVLSEFPSLVHWTIIYLVIEPKISEVFLHPSISLNPGKSNEAPGYADFNSQISPQSMPSFQPHHHNLHSTPLHGIPKLLPPSLLSSTSPIRQPESQLYITDMTMLVLLNGFIPLGMNIANVIWPPRLYGLESAHLSHLISSRVSSIPRVS